MHIFDSSIELEEIRARRCWRHTRASAGVRLLYLVGALASENATISAPEKRDSYVLDIAGTDALSRKS
jgi:hypothetical protein